MAELLCFSIETIWLSKMGRETLCFTIVMAVVGREGRICETAVAGHYHAMLAPRSFQFALERWFRDCAVESNVRTIFGECNCRLLDAL